MSKILIVEDDVKIHKLIEDTLAIAKYEIDSAYDGNEAIKKIKDNKYDLIILDIMLPEVDGFEVMDQIKNKEIPVIFLSAKSDVSSVVKGLQIGAQDYMTKPFEPLELLARIDLRIKNIRKKEKIYEYKDIHVNVSERTVNNGYIKIDLTPKEFELFILLLENIDIALTRDEILNKVWDISTDIETRTVDYHIQQLRKKLDLKNDIITVNKIGYRLEKRI